MKTIPNRTIKETTDIIYYELEHLTNSKLHKKREIQKVKLNKMVLGRGEKCNIRYGDDCGTVSQQHAAIETVKDGWKLTHLSRTNDTYVNDETKLTDVGDEYTLMVGDTVRLSKDGPLVKIISELKPHTITKWSDRRHLENKGIA